MASITLYAGNPGPRVRALEGASQSYKAGDLVQFILGLVKVGADERCNAIALEDASGTTSNPTEVELLSSDALYLAYNSGTIAVTDVGCSCNFDVSTAGAHTFAVATDDTDVFHVVMIPTTTTIGASGGYEVIRANPSYAQAVMYHAS